MEKSTLNEEELRERITQHLAARPGAQDIVIAWQGYLAGLIEWGIIDHQVHGRLVKLLPEGIGVEAMSEVLLGHDYQEVQRQLAEEDALRRAARRAALDRS